MRYSGEDSREMEKMFYTFFPEEIWDNILKRLPSKCLCRFLCVSKPWYSFITTPSFISSNLNHNINNETNNYMLLHVFLRLKSPHGCVEEFLFYPDHEISKSLGEPSLKQNLPFETDMPFHSILGICNGLICINYGLKIFLWNPSIHKFVELPALRIIESYPPPEECQLFGFGASLLDGDFKVIRVVMGNNDMGDESPPLPPLFEVYSLKTKRWGELNGGSFNPFWFRSSYVYMNGRCHWICNLVGNRDCSLVSFDINDEVFLEVPVPGQLAQVMLPYYSADEKLVTITLMEKECLAMLIRERSGSFRIWVMKEYGDSESWTNIYTIDIGLMEGYKFDQIIIVNKGNILMTGERHKLTCYDIATKLVSEFNIGGYYEHVNKYMESLVLLEPRFNI